MKDFNGPACGYVVIPRGGYGVNALGKKYWSHGYWSGDMFLAVWREFMEGRGPVYLKLDHLPRKPSRVWKRCCGAPNAPCAASSTNSATKTTTAGTPWNRAWKKSPCAPATATPAFVVNKDTETTVPGLSRQATARPSRSSI